MTRRVYKHSPIEEAFVEFRFGPSAEWDFTTPGKLHAHPLMKAAYPGKPRVQTLKQSGMPDVHRQQLVDANGTRLLSVGLSAISVHVLRPYDGWESYRRRITDALAAAVEVTGSDELVRIGVRYINRIVLHRPEPFELGEYFQFPVGIPRAPEVPSLMTGFVTRVEYVDAVDRNLVATFALLPPPVPTDLNTFAFLLDLDSSREGAIVTSEHALKIADELHANVGEAFERVITDKVREVFDGA